MPCDWVQTTWKWGYGGDPGVSVGLYLSFGPSPYMIAQCALSNAVSNGLLFSGITQYTVRPVPNGPDQPVSFNWDPNFGFPAEVWDYNMSSVNAQMDIGGGGGQYGKFSLTAFYLS
jgi:hypothetical protein